VLNPAPMPYSIPDRFIVDDSRFIWPDDTAPSDMPVRRGPNIRPLPAIEPLEDVVRAEILLYLPDDITTDHIVPAGANYLPIRSNTPEIAKHSFNVVDLTFPDRAKAAGAGVIMAGKNYGQGSSREQAALVPRFLGIRAIVAESFARIHLANLVNFGILPLVFTNPEDREKFKQGDVVRIDTAVLAQGRPYTVENVTTGAGVPASCPLSQEELDIVKAGGRLNWIRRRNEQAVV